MTIEQHQDRGWEKALDPALREAAIEYLRNLAKASHNDANMALSERMLCREIKEKQQGLTAGTLQIPLPVTAIVTIFLAVVSRPYFFAFAAVLIIGISLGAWTALSQQSAGPNGARYQELLRSFLPQGLQNAAKTKTEKRYVEAILQLMPSKSATNRIVPEDVDQTQITQLNDLLDCGRRLEAVSEEISVAFAGQEPGRLDKEHEALKDRIARTTDAQTRATLEQGLALCEERIRRTADLLVMGERVAAQLELTYQAFGAAQGAIAGLRLSSGSATSRAAEQTAEIAATIGRQTAAVEQAVQEVLALRTPG